MSPHHSKRYAKKLSEIFQILAQDSWQFQPIWYNKDMKHEIKIIEERTNKAANGVWFKVYVNGRLVGFQTSRELAEKFAQEIISRKVYR